jgi:hypothetical protein
MNLICGYISLTSLIAELRTHGGPLYAQILVGCSEIWFILVLIYEVGFGFFV